MPTRLWGNRAVMLSTSRQGIIAIAALCASLVGTPAQAAATEALYPINATGLNLASEGGLVQGSDGRLYGTQFGGTASSCGNGSIFALTPSSGAIATLHSFSDCNGAGVNGASPKAALLQGNDGNFYGTTYNGGGSTNTGVVFKLSPAGGLSLLHSFGSVAGDGANPAAELIQGSDGSFYGTTENGGASGNGTIYKISSTGVLTTLHSFSGTEGSHPDTHLLLGQDGRYYGTTSFGGSAGHGSAYVFNGSSVTVLYPFTGGSDGAGTVSALVQGADGSLYGTTQTGGAAGHGNIFKLSTAPDPNLPIVSLYSFSGGAAGDTPHGGLLIGGDGNLYGTTFSGGTGGDGLVYKITPAGTFSTVYSFGAVAHDAVNPYTTLVQTRDGTLYGIANGGSVNNTGAIFGLSGVFAAAPAAPTLNAASAGDAQVSLSWNAPAGATSYNVYQGTTPGGESATPVKSGVTATSATVTGLTDGKAYYFQVAAIGDGGAGSRSNEVSATPVAVPAAPAGLVATPGNAQVALNWSAAAGASSYIVYRGTAAGAETPLATGVSATSYTATGLNNGTTYYFEVAGMNGSGTGTRSAEASGTPATPASSSSSGGSSSSSSSSSGGGSGSGGGSSSPLLLAGFAALAALRRRRQVSEGTTG